jgi:hypothetical protein
MTPALAVDVLGVGLIGPGLSGWEQGAARLREPSTWTLAPTVVPTPRCLPPTEGRRAGPVVKAALAAAEQACEAAGVAPASLATVFTSSTGEPANCHALCEALAAAERFVSPTRFTNSVHNAAAGYWHIAQHSTRPSVSLGAYDASFAAGLFEAAIQSAAADERVLLVATDVPYPQPLHAVRPLSDSFSLALVLAPARPASAGATAAPGGLGRIGLAADAGRVPTRCGHAGLDAVRESIPAARALPLLQALLAPAAVQVVVPGFDDWSLIATVQPR